MPTTDTGIKIMTTLTDGICRRCRTPTFGGWSRNGRMAAELVTVDSQPLDPVQELRALVAGCRTWTLHTVARELHPRGPDAIRDRPAGTRPRQTVHATHVCTPAPWRIPP